MAFNKKQLMREIERDRRARAEQHLAELAARVRAARADRREAISRIKTQCRTARVKLRTNCGNRVERAREHGAKTIEERRQELHGERQFEKVQRTTDKRQSVRPKGQLRQARQREKASESDDEVRSNIPSSLLKVFEKVKRQIKGSERRTRTEAFLEWCESNPGEVYAIQDEIATRELKKMIREHDRAERKRALADVPF